MNEGVAYRAVQFDKTELLVQLEPTHPAARDHDAFLYALRLPGFGSLALTSATISSTDHSLSLIPTAMLA
jgi:hypothetical protein